MRLWPKHTMTASPHLRAQLAQRLRKRMPPGWQEFSKLWTAFNALYGGETGERERARVMSVVRRYVSARGAGNVLDRNKAAIAELIAAVAGILYQVRCNLVHGSKDPDDSRDRMLLRASLQILMDLVPAVERGMMASSK